LTVIAGNGVGFRGLVTRGIVALPHDRQQHIMSPIEHMPDRRYPGDHVFVDPVEIRLHDPEIDRQFAMGYLPARKISRKA
jgi:hypothetical protein